MASSWNINNKAVNSLTINNKEVQSIVRISDNAILYESGPITTVIGLTVSNNSINTGSTITLNGTSNIGSGKSIKIYQNNTLIDTVTTTTNGTFSKNLTMSTPGGYVFYASFDGDAEHTNSQSPNIAIMVSGGDSSIMHITTTSIKTFIPNPNSQGLTGTNMVAEWGDGTVELIPENTRLTHHYTNSAIRQINIANVKKINTYGFMSCSWMTGVSLPKTITSLSRYAFSACSSLIDYQLYWTTPVRSWSKDEMPNNTNTYFTIPNGTSANYIAKSYPSNKLIERSA